MKKAIVGTVSVAALIAYYYTRSKITDVQNIVPNLKPKLEAVNGINFGTGVIRLNVDIRLTNTTANSFSANTGTALKFEKAEVFTPGGVKIADAVKEVSNINIPAFGGVIIKDVAVVIYTSSISSVAVELITGNKLDQLVINAHIEALGKKYIV